MIRLREVRKSKGLRQKDIAKRMQRSTACICGWESGLRQPSLDDVSRLADILAVSVDYLIGREDELGLISLNANLTMRQNQLIAAFDKLDNDSQLKVIGFAEALKRDL